MGNQQAVEFTQADIDEYISCGRVMLVADGKVFDATSFIHDHPAGDKCILKKNGKNCTQDLHFHSKSAQGLWMKFCVGKFVTKRNPQALRPEKIGKEPLPTPKITNTPEINVSQHMFVPENTEIEDLGGYLTTPKKGLKGLNVNVNVNVNVTRGQCKHANGKADCINPCACCIHRCPQCPVNSPSRAGRTDRDEESEEVPSMVTDTPGSQSTLRSPNGITPIKPSESGEELESTAL